MTRLFRDWRFALMVVLGIAAMAASYAAQEPSNPDPLPQAPVAQPPQPKPSPRAMASSPSTEPDVERETSFGEPVLDPSGFDPNPPDSHAGESAPAATASAGGANLPASGAP